MPAIAALAEGRRPVKEQAACPSMFGRREVREMMDFSSELRGSVAAASMMSTRLRVNVLVDARKIVLQNWRVFEGGPRARARADVSESDRGGLPHPRSFERGKAPRLARV